MRRKLTVLAVLTSFLLIAGASAWFFWVRSTPTSAIDTPGQINSRLNVLIVGLDKGIDGPQRTDTLMLASFDPETGEVSILSIPRDTRVIIPGRPEKDKITHAYAYGGIKRTLQTVSQFTDMPINYYITVSTDGFRKMVDTMGGVWIDVEKDMDYVDSGQDLYIDLTKGYQLLNGEDAEGYVRYRKDDSDFARSARQQKFMKEAIKQALKPGNLLKIDDMFRVAMETVQTNIPLTVALRYLPMAYSFNTDKITTFTVEGNDAWIFSEKYQKDLYYFEPNMSKLNEILDTRFRASVNSANADIKVSIQIANGDKSSGERLAQILRKQGYQVLEVVEAGREDRKVSEVISTRTDPVGALAVSRSLNIPTVLTDSKAHKTADVVVFVGRDMRP